MIKMSLQVNLDPFWTMVGLSAAGFASGLGTQAAAYLFKELEEKKKRKTLAAKIEDVV